MDVLLEIWRLLDSGQRRRLLLTQAVAIATGVSTLVGIAAAVPFFAALGDIQMIHRSRWLQFLYSAFAFDDERRFMVVLGGLFIVILLLSNGVNLLGSLLMNRFAHRIGSHFCITLFDDYLHRDYLFHVQSNSATLLSNVTWETARATTGILQSVSILNANLVTAALIIVSISLVNAWVAAATLLVLAGSYLVVYLLARRRLLSNGLLESRHTAQRAKIANESFGAIKEIILLRSQAPFRADFARSCRALAAIAANTQAIAQSPRHILECIAVGGLVGISLLLITRGGHDGGWLAQLAFLGFAAYRLLPALQQVYQSIVRIRADRVAFTRLADDLRQACRRAEAPSRETKARDGQSPPRDIRLTGVSFRYGDDRPPAIRDATLRIPAGAIVGLAGVSGSGKTTLADLIAGLLVPTSGSIEIGARPLDETSRTAWQSTVAYVPQEIFLLDASVAQNIALGFTRQQIDRQRVRRAAELACVHRFIETLPRGYDEILGEDGVRLSGGQRQRIGIARALYRDASLVLMDEATSALDSPTESEIMSTLQRFRGQRTIVLITHRLSALRRCDLIYELDKGVIVDCGVYEELMRRSERFRCLARGCETAAI
jgi:ATP-binding cassette, subfamily B, bacterial PglK